MNYETIVKVASVREKSDKIMFYSRSGKSQGGLYHAREFVDPCTKSVKSQGIRLPQMFLYKQGNFCLEII